MKTPNNNVAASVTASAAAVSSAYDLLQWQEQGKPHMAMWRSESSLPQPKRIAVADDTMPADTAFRHISEGASLLWRGDFQNARQLLLALGRRLDKKPRRKAAAPVAFPHAFHLHRQAQAQRARVLASILIELDEQWHCALRRAPDWSVACSEAWGQLKTEGGAHSVLVPLRDLLGVVGAHEWRKKGVEIAALGADARIHAHYGVFSPVRGEYLDLVARAPIPAAGMQQAWDIGTGTGVLSALLLKRGVKSVVATDMSERALACAAENLQRLGYLGLATKAELKQTNLFPEGRAGLIVCNPPWLPGKATSLLDQAIYDEDSRMLRGFVQGLAEHLQPGGEGWLIVSDLAEHLKLRTREQLLGWIEAAGLKVLGREDIRPHHSKVQDKEDPLHAARAAEVTSLWRLAAA